LHALTPEQQEEAMAEIKLKNVKKSFGKAHIIKGVDLDIKEREFVVFVGPSGCGKSTLLRLVAGLEDISSGELIIDNERVNDLPPPERGIAMVFQSYALYPHMTVYENMAFGLKLSKKHSGQTIDQKVREAAEILQITHLLKHTPKQLSGGQRQRVAIGRAIVRSPKVFLFDEPLSNLDASLRVQMRIEISKLHHKLGATMIYVTHDQVEAMTLADKIVVLRDGLVEQVGSPLELYHYPANQFVAGFIGSPQMNFIHTKITDVKKNGVVVALPGGKEVLTQVESGTAKVGDAVVLGIRPEHLTIDKGKSSLQGKISLIEEMGGESYVYVALENGETITLRVAGECAVPEGDSITLNVPSELCHLFDENEQAFTRLAKLQESAAA
jgi:ABC-type sugar transport system ATPase subunit